MGFSVEDMAFALVCMQDTKFALCAQMAVSIRRPVGGVNHESPGISAADVRLAHCFLVTSSDDVAGTFHLRPKSFQRWCG